MEVKELKRVKEQGVKSKIDFIDSASFALNLTLDKNLIKSRSTWIELNVQLPTAENQNLESQNLESQNPESQTISVIKTYTLEGVKFCYCSDNHLYKEENGAFSLFCEKTFSSAPQLLTVLIEGERRTLIILGESGVLRGFGEQEITLPSSKISQVCNGILFLAMGNTIYFGEPFNFETFSVDLNPKGLLKIDVNYGEIIALESIETDLQIICEHGILSLSTLGQSMEYTLKPYSLPYLDIVAGSVQKIGNAIYFISENRLCFLYNQKLATQDLLFGTDIKAMGKASKYKGYYLLPVSFIDKSALYVKNVNSGREWFTHLPQALSSVGGIGISPNGKLCALCFDGDKHFSSQYITKSEYTGEAGYLQEISFENTADITLKIQGDYQEKTFKFPKGKNKTILGYKTQKYALVFESDNSPLEIKNLYVKVR